MQTWLPISSTVKRRGGGELGNSVIVVSLSVKPPRPALPGRPKAGSSRHALLSRRPKLERQTYYYILFAVCRTYGIPLCMYDAPRFFWKAKKKNSNQNSLPHTR